jgi:hypothetical protein
VKVPTTGEIEAETEIEDINLIAAATVTRR